MCLLRLPLPVAARMVRNWSRILPNSLVAAVDIHAAGASGVLPASEHLCVYALHRSPQHCESLRVFEMLPTKAAAWA